jgi:hypothetical protein
VTLDKWQPKWIETVKKIGNRIGNSYYEHNLDKGNPNKPKEGDPLTKVAKYVQLKYERKDFAPKGKLSPSELLAQGRDPDMYDGNGNAAATGGEAVTSERQAATNGSNNATQSAAAPSRPAKAPATAKPAPAETVDLLGGLQESVPVVAAAQPSQQPPGDLFSGLSTSSVQTPNMVQGLTSLQLDSGPPSSMLPGAFGAAFQQQPTAAPPPIAPAQPGPEQLQDQKAGALLNSLTSLYSQPANPTPTQSNRFDSLNGLAGMQGPTMQQQQVPYGGIPSYGGGLLGAYGVGYGGSALPAAAAATSMPPQMQQQQQFMHQQQPPMQQNNFMQFGQQPLGGGVQQTTGPVSTQGGSGIMGSTVGKFGGGTLKASGMTAEALPTSHAAAMDQILGSLGGTAAAAPRPQPSASPKNATNASGNQVDIGIDAFSAFGSAIRT